MPGFRSRSSIQAVCPRFTLELTLTPEKPFVIHGENGVSQKSPEPGRASHYISFTRLLARGKLERKGSSIALNGLAWMDHEFFTEQLDNSEAGWDWFSIQLQNNEEIMLYRLRKKSGEADSYSSGTYIDTRGEGHSLASSQFTLSPGGSWKSPNSQARYPLAWEIGIPSLSLQLSERTPLNNQELFSRDRAFPTYWEGAVTYSGHVHSRPVTGLGYLEMTGYDKPLQLSRR